MAAEKGFERHVEELDVNRSHIMAHPFFENIHEEATVLLGTYRALRHQVAGLRVEQTFAIGPLAPTRVGDGDCLCGGALDDGDELYPLCAKYVAEEAIHRTTVFLVCGVDRAENVEVDPVPLQATPALHHPIEGALCAVVDSVGVVQFARAIHAQADQKLVFLEERAPVIVHEDSVGLEGVLYGLAWLAVFLDKINRVLEELEFHQRRLAALPRHRYLGRTMRLQQLADVDLQCCRGHAVLFVRIERLLGQEVAIGAVDVAGGSARLGHHMEIRRGINRRAIEGHVGQLRMRVLSGS